MDAGILDLLKELAHHKSHEAGLDKRLEWQEVAQDLLDNELDHLDEPPDVCPICGNHTYQEFNAKYRVIVVRCESCAYMDEWDEPDRVNPAAHYY